MIDKEKIKKQVRDTLEFQSPDSSGRTIVYITCKHIVQNLPKDIKETCNDVVREIINDYNMRHNIYE